MGASITHRSEGLTKRTKKMGATEEIHYGRLGSRAAALPPICEPKCRDEIDIFVRGLNPLVDEHPIFRKEGGGSATEPKNSHQFPPPSVLAVGFGRAVLIHAKYTRRVPFTQSAI
jgi:hypothetical protein